MNVLRLAESLLDGSELTPGQLAELRAIGTMAYSEFARGEAPADIFERVLCTTAPDADDASNRPI